MKVHNKLFTSFLITCYRVIYTIECPLSRGKKVKKSITMQSAMNPFGRCAIALSVTGRLRTLCQLPRTRGSLPSQALRASSPAGRAKCTPVGGG